MLSTIATQKQITSFAEPASDEKIKRTARALEANGIHTLVAENGEEARKLFFELIPEGAQVHQGASMTLEALGITESIETSGRFEAVRPAARAMNRQTQAHDMRRLTASPDYMVGSVQAVTEAGQVILASAAGSQLGPYVSGAGKVVWVVGAQKLVADLNEGFRRIDEFALPLEDERLLKVLGVHTSLNKVVIINKERPGRITMIIVKEGLGF